MFKDHLKEMSEWFRAREGYESLGVPEGDRSQGQERNDFHQARCLSVGLKP